MWSLFQKRPRRPKVGLFLAMTMFKGSPVCLWQIFQVEEGFYRSIWSSCEIFCPKAPPFGRYSVANSNPVFLLICLYFVYLALDQNTLVKSPPNLFLTQILDPKLDQLFRQSYSSKTMAVFAVVVTKSPLESALVDLIFILLPSNLRDRWYSIQAR